MKWGKEEETNEQNRNKEVIEISKNKLAVDWFRWDSVRDRKKKTELRK